MRLQGVPNLTGYLWHRRPMSFHGGSWCCCDHVASAFLGVWRGAWDSVGRTWSWYTAIIKHAGDLLPIGHYIPSIQHYCWSLDFVAAYRTWLQAFARRLQAEEGFFCASDFSSESWSHAGFLFDTDYWLLIKNASQLCRIMGIRCNLTDVTHATGGSKSTSRYSHSCNSNLDQIGIMFVMLLLYLLINAERTGRSYILPYCIDWTDMCHCQFWPSGSSSRDVAVD